MNSTRRIAISIDEGRTVRDLFYNGLLDLLIDNGVQVTVFTEAITVPQFIQTWKRPGIEFTSLLPISFTRMRHYAFLLRRKLLHWNLSPLLRGYLAAEQRFLYSAHKEYTTQLNDFQPDLIVTTNALLLKEAQLISTAHELGIPTLGLVRSWDNVHKGLQIRPEHLAVWNTINRQEVIAFDRYQPQAVTIIGAPQFDPYFAEDTIWPREKLAEHFGLDPDRPIILYASLGYFIRGLDETCWMDVLLEHIDNGSISGNPQVICRLHPWSRVEHFQQFVDHPDVRLSYVDRYFPTLTWYMTREDVVLVANMLNHADAVVTPASTMVMEAAIFDTPTVVPTFHPYQPERAQEYFDNVVFGKHFKRVKNLDLVPVVSKIDEFASVINRCLTEPSWYRDQRTKLVKDYVHFTDGRSVERLVALILKLGSNQRKSMNDK